MHALLDRMITVVLPVRIALYGRGAELDTARKLFYQCGDSPLITAFLQATRPLHQQISRSKNTRIRDLQGKPYISRARKSFTLVLAEREHYTTAVHYKKRFNSCSR